MIVYVQDLPITSEPDQERNCRAVEPIVEHAKAEEIEQDLLQAVAQTLHGSFTRLPYETYQEGAKQDTS